MEQIGIFHNHPKAPGLYMAVTYHIDRTTHKVTNEPNALVGADLEELRRAVPNGMTRLPRMFGDPDFLIETWI